MKENRRCNLYRFAKAFDFDRVGYFIKDWPKSYKHFGLEGRCLLGFKAGYQVEDKRWSLVTYILAG